MTRIALSALALVAATGCIEPTTDCVAQGLCAQPFGFEQGRQSPFFDETLAFADPGFELVDGGLTVEGLTLVAQVRHDVACAAPELEVSIQTLTAALPASARGTAELFATGPCEVVLSSDAKVRTSEVRLDLAPTLEGLGCVGELILSVPTAETSSGETGAVSLALGDAACEDTDLPALIEMPFE